MPAPLLLLPLLALLDAPASRSLVTVSATYEAPKKKGDHGAVVVMLSPQDPAVHVNEEPGPRLKLGAEQKVLVDKQPPAAKAGLVDPDQAKYLDPLIPVRFPVALSGTAPRGLQDVPATVTYFYCSKREGWCRKGSTDVLVTVKVD